MLWILVIIRFLHKMKVVTISLLSDLNNDQKRVRLEISEDMRGGQRDKQSTLTTSTF